MEELEANVKPLTIKEVLVAGEGVLQIWNDLYSNQADPEEREAWQRFAAALEKAKVRKMTKGET